MSFEWFQEIYKRLDDGRYSISSSKLKRAIEQYDVDTKDSKSLRLFIDYANHMTMKQIDMLLSYKPSITFVVYWPEPRIYWHGYYDKKTVMILDRLLRHDVDHVYNTYPIYYDLKRYNNLLELINWLLNEDEILLTDYHQRILYEQRDLLDNHMKKSITLFELMKPHLEESNKKRRFQ